MVNVAREQTKAFDINKRHLRFYDCMLSVKSFASKHKIITVIVVVGVTFILSLGNVHAEQSPWTVNNTTLTVLKDNMPRDEFIPIQGGSTQCMNQVFRTLSPLFSNADKYKLNVCAYDTSFGQYSSGTGYLLREGTGVATQVISYSNRSMPIIQIPQSKAAFLTDSLTGTTSGSYLYKYNDFGSELQPEVDKNDRILNYRVKNPPNSTLSNPDGSKMLVLVNSISANGKWLTLEAVSTGMFRMDTDTMRLTPFMNLNTSFGIGSWNMVISSDGRYVAAYSSYHNIFRLYDMDTCIKPVLAKGEQCQYFDITNYLKGKIPEGIGISRLKFASSGDLEFYTAKMVGNLFVGAHYLLSNNQYSSRFEYLGLGDSFSSGEGAYQYRAGTDISSNKCHTSKVSYPYLLGKDLGLNTYASVACSGSIIEHISSTNINLQQRAYYVDGLPSIDEVNNNQLPGYQFQKIFISDLKPSIITLTAGGNNIGFSDIIKRCLSFDTCYGFKGERETVLNLADDQFEPLTRLYSDLLNTVGKDKARVYVAGYPLVSDPEGNCANNVHLNKQELYFANDLIVYINSVIKKAAQKAGVYYVDLEKSLDGYKMCETDSWKVAVNGLTAGSDIPGFASGPIGNESYHPNAHGHSLMAQAIARSTDNFEAAMPAPDSSYVYTPNHTGLSILDNAPRNNKVSNRLPRYYYSEDLNFYKHRSNKIIPSDQNNYLAPSSSFDIYLHSDPVFLGKFSTDSRGKLEADIQIPSYVPAGYHTLHILGKNIAGEDIDLFKTVYVYGTDTEQIEQGICPAGVSVESDDQDKDGIIDSCDGFIDKEPEVVIPIEPPSPDPEVIVPVDPTPPDPSTEPDPEVIAPTDPVPTDPEIVMPTDTAPLDPDLPVVPEEDPSPAYSDTPITDTDPSPQVASATLEQLQSNPDSLGQHRSSRNIDTNYSTLSTVLNQSTDNQDTFAASNYTESVSASELNDPLQTNNQGLILRYKQIIITSVAVVSGFLLLFARKRRNASQIN